MNGTEPEKDSEEISCDAGWSGQKILKIVCKNQVYLHMSTNKTLLEVAPATNAVRSWGVAVRKCLPGCHLFTVSN